MTYLMHALATFGALAMGWYAGHEPYSPLPDVWRWVIVVGGTLSIITSLTYFVHRDTRIHHTIDAAEMKSPGRMPGLDVNSTLMARAEQRRFG